MSRGRGTFAQTPRGQKPSCFFPQVEKQLQDDHRSYTDGAMIISHSLDWHHHCQSLSSGIITRTDLAPQIICPDSLGTVVLIGVDLVPEVEDTVHVADNRRQPVPQPQLLRVRVAVAAHAAKCVADVVSTEMFASATDNKVCSPLGARRKTKKIPNPLSHRAEWQ